VLSRPHATGNWHRFLRAKEIFSLSDTEKLRETGSNIVETPCGVREVGHSLIGFDVRKAPILLKYAPVELAQLH
jgi:hypothetical protein